MASSYSVLIIDNFHTDPEEDFTIDGFPTLEQTELWVSCMMWWKTPISPRRT